MTKVTKKREYISPKRFHQLERDKEQLHRDFNDLIEAFIEDDRLLVDVQREYYRLRLGESFRVRIPHRMKASFIDGSLDISASVLIERCVVLTRTR
jgi:hypothetical protein